MSDFRLPRRDFLLTSAAITAGAVHALSNSANAAESTAAKLALLPFDYNGVKLRESRWQKQYQAARDFYLSIPDDDILCGYRKAAGLPAPGKPLGGWCGQNSNTVFGQWLSGMSRFYRATGDAAIRDKAVLLLTEWAKTVKPDGNCGMRHYPFDKLVCGLVDMKRYADNDTATELLEKICDYAAANFNHDNVPAPRGGGSGRPSEWYTLAENLFRAYQLTGNEKYKKFAEVWLYDDYWNKFANTPAPVDAHGVHAYSHVNTWSSCAMAYAVTGDAKYLQILKNAYDYLQNLQCYATGGFGPSEFIAITDGGLGRALETRFDTFETGCGSWAAFKMTRYLMSFTGESRYGDWTERVFYNGIGAALPVTDTGRNFYYSDYRLVSAMKTYNWDLWTCCSGTYIQAVADFPNCIYYKDNASGALCVNLFVPSEVTWQRPDSVGGGEIKLVQETEYPVAETTTLTLDVSKPTDLPLKFRVPQWAKDVAVRVNGESANVECKPGSWATIERTWKSGDKVEIRIPLPLRMQPVDAQHPDRVAVVRGPVALVLEVAYDDPFKFPKDDEELNAWAKPDNGVGPTSARGKRSLTPIPGAFALKPPDGTKINSLLRPFYTVDENYPYRMYFDRNATPVVYWK
jgi:DUF1680 family protein